MYCGLIRVVNVALCQLLLSLLPDAAAAPGPRHFGMACVVWIWGLLSTAWTSKRELKISSVLCLGLTFLGMLSINNWKVNCIEEGAAPCMDLWFAVRASSRESKQRTRKNEEEDRRRKWVESSADMPKESKFATVRPSSWKNKSSL